jgi:hypothetical protein
MIPGGGGNDISGASPGRWPGTLEIEFGAELPVIVAPKNLQFRRIESDRTSDFFLLETHPLAPPNGYTMNSATCLVDFTELSDGRLVEASAMERREWGGKPLPQESRTLSWCLGGSFLVVMRMSRYNKVSETYDGSHVRLSADQLAKALDRTPLTPESTPLRVSAAFEKEDLGWQDEPSLRPSLSHLSVPQVEELIRVWPKYQYRDDMGLDWSERSSEALTRLAEESDTRDRLIRTLLESLTDYALLELVTLMYVGRDGGHYPLSLRRWRQFLHARKSSRHEHLRVLTEKPDAPTYLERGLGAIGAIALKHSA